VKEGITSLRGKELLIGVAAKKKIEDYEETSFDHGGGETLYPRVSDRFEQLGGEGEKRNTPVGAISVPAKNR